MRHLNLFCCLFLAGLAPAQQPPSLGASAVSAVLSQYTMNVLTHLPGTQQPLPSNGKWSIRTARPGACPHDDTPCVRVIYTVPEAHVACEWTVIPAQGATPAVFLDQNEDASRYLLRKLAASELTPLILTSPQPTYPPIARAAHVVGSVLVRVVVAANGAVTSATPITGPQMVFTSAVEAAKHWTFQPLQVGSQPAPFTADLTGDFNLDKKVPVIPFGDGTGRKLETHSPDGTVSLHP